VLRAVLDDCLATLLPAVCPGCGAVGAPVCSACTATLRPAPAGAPPVGIDWWSAPFSYEGVAREVVARAKYRDQRAGLRWLAWEMLGVCPKDVALDVVTWPPASEARVRAYGVDHGRFLARVIGRGMQRPVRPLLQRAPGRAQTGAPRSERTRGPVVRAIQSVRGVNVLVVDDVSTTGATLIAVADALRQAGAHSVAALTATRTPRGNRF
jgi:predicted amidophosphoribosyltransferase